MTTGPVETDLAGRRVLLVGVGGIGAAVAERLASRGAQVFGTFHSQAGPGEELGQRLSPSGWAGQSQLDVTDAEAVQAVAGTGGLAAQALGGPVDTLVVTTGHRHPLQMLTDQDPATTAQIVATELLGPIQVVRAVLPSMLETDFGRIVLVGSDSGKAGTMGDAASAAARAGLLGFTRSVARETARADVTVNVVSPGPTQTPLLQGMLAADGLTGTVMNGTVRAIPKRRTAQPDEIAEAVAYFVGPAAGFTTGQVLSISGGLTMS